MDIFGPIFTQVITEWSAFQAFGAYFFRYYCQDFYLRCILFFSTVWNRNQKRNYHNNNLPPHQLNKEKILNNNECGQNKEKILKTFVIA